MINASLLVNGIGDGSTGKPILTSLDMVLTLVSIQILDDAVIAVALFNFIELFLKLRLSEILFEHSVQDRSFGGSACAYFINVVWVESRSDFVKFEIEETAPG